MASSESSSPVADIDAFKMECSHLFFHLYSNENFPANKIYIKLLAGRQKRCKIVGVVHFIHKSSLISVDKKVRERRLMMSFPALSQ